MVTNPNLGTYPTESLAAAEANMIFNLRATLATPLCARPWARIGRFVEAAAIGSMAA
jgi:hypothetical protein